MPFELESQRLGITQLSSEYAEQVQEYLVRNRYFFQRYMPRWPQAFCQLENIQLRLNEEKWLQQQGRFIRYYIFHRSDKQKNRIIGDISYSHFIYGAMRSCFLGYKVDQSFNNLGVATESLRLLNPETIQRFDLQRIEAHIMPKNKGSRHLIEKLGFELEGIAKQFICINGQWEDHCRYAFVKGLNQEEFY